MFQHIRNHSQAITQTEKFYYDDYDYYNIYEVEEKEYKDDLSKFIYHCNRRTTPTIVVYNPKLKNMRTPHERFIKVSERYEKFYHNFLYPNMSSDGKITMEQFIDTFLEMWVQNNYSDQHQSYEKDQHFQQFHIISQSSINDQRYLQQNQSCPFSMDLLSFNDLQTILGKLSEVSEQKISWLEDQYQNQNNPGIFNLQCQVSFELFAQYVLTKKYSDANTLNFHLLYEHIVEVNRIMWEILNNRIRTVLLLSQPKVQYINYLVHPLVLPITIFLKYTHLQYTNSHQKLLTGVSFTEKPRIVLINLDGTESPHNIRNIRALRDHFLYISLFNEPSWFRRKNENMKEVFTSDEDVEVDFKSICELFSQFLVQEYLGHCTEQADVPEMLLFPLNSSFLRKKFKKIKKETGSNKNFPAIESAREISFLFQNVIYDKIREFRPTMIFVSYNGRLQQLNKCSSNPEGLAGTHVFGDIIRNCSIFSDHRVILFPNFTEMFQFQENNYLDDEQQMNDVDGKIKCAKEFYEKYFSFEVSDFQDIFQANMNNTISINNEAHVLHAVKQEPLFECLSLFLKFGPGLYKMDDGLLESMQTPTWKYHMANQYGYLDLLQNVANFPFMKNRSITKITSSELQELFYSYGLEQIRQNDKQNEYYQKIISTAISELACQSISDESLKSILSKPIYYQLQAVIQELIGQQLQTNPETIEQDIDEHHLLQTHLQGIKHRMLLQNMENFKFKKHYYLPQNKMIQNNSIQCLKFVMRQKIEDQMEIQSLNAEDQSNELTLEKYSQIFINNTNNFGNNLNTVFIVNYRLPESNRHMILVGNFNSLDAEKRIGVEEVRETDRELSEQVQEYFQAHYINEEGHNYKQDTIYINYNHCFCGPNLYLFWPLQYDLKDQVRCRLLNINYNPKRVFKMLKISPIQDQITRQTIYRYEKVVYDHNNESQIIDVLPRWGCTTYPINQYSFYIFGGIFQNQLDYITLRSNVQTVNVSPSSGISSFSIAARSKRVGDQVLSCFKPKINYKIDKDESKGNDRAIKIYSGYGRYNTNFFNLFSYEEFQCDQKFFPIKNQDNRSIRKIVSTQRPLSINKIGKYSITNNMNNVNACEQKFSDEVKQKFIFEKKNDNMKKVGNYDIFSLMDNSYRIYEFKTHKKRQYLFGFLQNIREKIYTKCWSPQLYIVNQKFQGNLGFKPHVVNLSLKTEKNSNYITPNYLMPKQDDIMAMCIEQDKIYMISNSPIIHFLQGNQPGKFMLYEGWLGNMREVISKREVQMNNKFTFSSLKCEKFMGQKSLFVNQNYIYIVGGLSYPAQNNLSFKSDVNPNQQQIFEREDYILYENRNKYIMKTRKLSIGQDNLDMPNSIAIKNRKNYYLYSIVLEENANNGEMSENISSEEYEIWKMKIECHEFENYEGESKYACGQFKVYFFNSGDQQIQKYPSAYLQNPKFVSITPYKRFSISQFNILIPKVLWNLKKNSHRLRSPELKKLAIFFEELMLRDDIPEDFLTQKISENVQIFEDMITLLIQQENQKHNYNEGNHANDDYDPEQLIKGLKQCYHLVSKLALQRAMALGPDNSDEQEYRFIVEDRTSKKVKYLAIGRLGTTRLNFFRIRFTNEVIFCMNHSDDNGFFYHPTIVGCMRFEYESLRNNQNNSIQYNQWEQVRSIKVSSYKN